jgi:hypothetical protein
MSLALGVFVTLVGAIYQNLNRRLEGLEKAAEEKLVTRREYDQWKETISKQLTRIEDALKEAQTAGNYNRRRG